MKEVRQLAMKPSWHDFEDWDTGQKRGEERPPYQKPYPKTAQLIDLPAYESLDFQELKFSSCVVNRRSRRKFDLEHNISMEVLSYLLFLTNGIENKEKPMLRTAPSGGARHAIETYLYIDQMEALEKGLYRYLPIEHALLPIHKKDIRDLEYGLEFTFGAPVTFMWTAVPWRMEWRYGDCAEKIILLDAGHICQNLYLACEAIGLGTCAVGAYDQDPLDAFMEIDGENEFLIYGSPLGKVVKA